MNTSKQPLKAASTVLFEFENRGEMGPTTTNPTTTTIGTFTTGFIGHSGTKRNKVKEAHVTLSRP